LQQTAAYSVQQSTMPVLQQALGSLVNLNINRAIVFLILPTETHF